jgi:FkbM family methyltransferase
MPAIKRFVKRMTRRFDRYIINPPAQILLRKVVAYEPARTKLQQMARAGRLPMNFVRRLPLAPSALVEVTVPTLDCAEGQFRMTPSESAITRALFWDRGWQIFGYGAQVYYELAKDAAVVVDAGANVGVYTLVSLAASSTSHVFAFEPVPRVYENLTANVLLNGWTSRATLSRSALADAPGEAEFSIPRELFPESARLGRYAPSTRWPRIAVQVQTLDEVLNGCDHCDLVKIDVEGAELLLLRGMKKTFLAHAPILWMELLPGAEVAEVEALLEPHEYVFFRETPERSLHRERHLFPDVEGRFRNWYLVPQKRLSAFEAADARTAQRLSSTSPGTARS